MHLPADTIAVHSPASLPESDWLAWSALQEAQACYEAPSLRPEFVRLLAPLRPYLRIAVATAQGRTILRPRTDKRRRGWKWPDSSEAVSPRRA